MKILLLFGFSVAATTKIVAPRRKAAPNLGAVIRGFARREAAADREARTRLPASWLIAPPRELQKVKVEEKCPDKDSFANWMTQFLSFCDIGRGGEKTDFSDPLLCSQWLVCDCVHRMYLIPVNHSDINICVDQTMEEPTAAETEKVDSYCAEVAGTQDESECDRMRNSGIYGLNRTEVQEFIWALLYTCEAQTKLMTYDCGQCDLFREQNDECVDTSRREIKPTEPPTLPPPVAYAPGVAGFAMLLFLFAAS